MEARKEDAPAYAAATFTHHDSRPEAAAYDDAPLRSCPTSASKAAALVLRRALWQVREGVGLDAFGQLTVTLLIAELSAAEGGGVHSALSGALPNSDSMPSQPQQLRTSQTCASERMSRPMQRHC